MLALLLGRTWPLFSVFYQYLEVHISLTFLDDGMLVDLFVNRSTPVTVTTPVLNLKFAFCVICR